MSNLHVNPAILHGVQFQRIDHSRPLPFGENMFDVVVASLSIHYFSKQVTFKVVEEISRVTTSDGFLICRVNSDKDFNFGACGFPEIERGLYMVDGIQKRFFGRQDVFDYFSSCWHILDIKEIIIDRYSEQKCVWQFLAKNKKYVTSQKNSLTLQSGY